MERLLTQLRLCPFLPCSPRINSCSNPSADYIIALGLILSFALSSNRLLTEIDSHHTTPPHTLHKGETLTTFARLRDDQQHAPPRQLALAAPRFFAPRRANGRSDWRAWQIDLFPLSHGCITCTTLDVRDSWESVSQGKSAQNRSFSRESRISVGRGQHAYIQ